MNSRAIWNYTDCPLSYQLWWIDHCNVLIHHPHLDAIHPQKHKISGPHLLIPTWGGEVSALLAPPRPLRLVALVLAPRPLVLNRDAPGGWGPCVLAVLAELELAWCCEGEAGTPSIWNRVIVSHDQMILKRAPRRRSKLHFLHSVKMANIISSQY